MLIEIALSFGLLCLHESALRFGTSVLKALLRSASVVVLTYGPLTGGPKIDNLSHISLDGSDR
jgi:hypothetical protein